MGIIDIHTHLGMQEVPKEVLEKMASGYHQETGQFGAKSIDQMITEMDEVGIEKAVLLASDAETLRPLLTVSNEAVAEAVSKYPDRLIGFGSADPHKGILAVREIERAVRELNLKGLKFVPGLLELYPNDKEMYRIYEKARELSIPILFHTGTDFFPDTKIKYCRPIYLDDVAIDFPELTLIMAHFSWPWTEEAIAIVQRNRNVYMDISGWSPKYFPEVLVRYINGPISGKALFGSDYPTLPLKRIIPEFNQLPLKEESKKKILYENAKRVLKL